MAIMWCGGQEQAMFEPWCQIANRPGNLRIDSVLLTAGRGGVVGFVEYEHRPTAERAQVIAERTGVGFVDQQPMRNQKTGVGAPRIDTESAFATDAFHVILVEDFKSETE